MRPTAALRAIVLLATLVLVGTGAVGCTNGRGLKVGLAYAIGGPGDHGFNDSALSGLNRARTELTGSVTNVRALSARANETEENQYRRLSLLCKAGYNPVIAVGFTYAGANPDNGPLARASKDCPDTHFAIIDDDSVRRPNVANLVFADEQGAYLMGIVAASKSSSHVIGFVGACDVPVINRFLAGYQAGADAIEPTIKIDQAYVSTDPRRCDFTNVDAARAVAAKVYAGGADVVFQAAGGAGVGVFEAASSVGRLAIGADEDQYETVEAPLRSVIVTSMVKRVDVAVFDFIKGVSQGQFKAGIRRYDLADGGLEYATSGGRIADLIPTLQAYQRKIITGMIIVPTSS